MRLLLNDALGFSDESINSILRLQDIYPGVVVKATQRSSDLMQPGPISEVDITMARHHMAIEGFEGHLELHEVRCLEDIHVRYSYEEGKWDEVLRYGDGLTRRTQDLFIAYIRTRDEFVGSSFIETLEAERDGG